MRPTGLSLLSVLRFFWERFLILGWIGKGVAIFLTLYGTGWVFGTLGAHGLAERLGSAGKFVLSLLLVALLFILIWRLARKPGQ